MCLLQTFSIFSKRFSRTDSHVHNSYINIRSTKRALRQSNRLGRQSFAVKLEHFEGHHGTSEGQHGKLLHCRRLFQALRLYHSKRSTTARGNKRGGVPADLDPLNPGPNPLADMDLPGPYPLADLDHLPRIWTPQQN